ncbi:Peptidoglycan/LPS O-acetylase OafA/YrhL, contains acyltransferase and SGNH-hydrolase domains [Noviherbaspirillum humi]|uniref:Peptidoglycan/LPS O-acetylase OafA/YrhL, contains acyltransferase and SGNH-hydrolase domains n=1 Tax=Noviherbaspirillum humi TaxID=1688639 RepID=A0A239HK46_9BURK|nr:acyltransferase [Noviherbaspirillum humi]SNS81766.1 Peptidoglycan/LPS O-acetylase OafA/YrhL, contains acyltransferase and SGNH-hydrolase domains [Noviherbaspirillum humi]
MHWLKEKFELSRGQINLQPMEGMRGFAVLLVFMVHYATLVKPWIREDTSVHSLLEALHTIGNAGVDLFFVLSGYLIYGSLLARKQTFFEFITRRIQRIYPTFIAIFVVYLTLLAFFPAESKIPKEGAILYLVQNFLLLPGLFPIEPLITVAWSLSYEMFYYLVMPVTVTVIGLRSRGRIWRICFISTVAIVTTSYCVLFSGPIRLNMFIVGILLYESIKSGQIRQSSGLMALLALTSALFATLMHGYIEIGFMFVGFYLFCLHCFLHPTDWLARAFSWAPMRLLGNMSYSYYLLHGLALKAGFLVLSKFKITQGEILFFGLLPVMFALTIGASVVLFLVIERPLSLTPVRNTKEPIPQAAQSS